MTLKSESGNVAPECREAVYQELTKVCVASTLNHLSWLEKANLVVTRLSSKYDSDSLWTEICDRLRKMYGVNL